MQQFINNRYVRLSGLTEGIAAIFFGIIWLVALLFNMQDFPVGLEILLAVLGAGIVVYKIFASRVF